MKERCIYKMNEEIYMKHLALESQYPDIYHLVAESIRIESQTQRHEKKLLRTLSDYKSRYINIEMTESVVSILLYEEFCTYLELANLFDTTEYKIKKFVKKFNLNTEIFLLHKLENRLKSVSENGLGCHNL